MASLPRATVTVVSAVTPWWGIPLFTLAGAVLGGLVTEGLGMIHDWRKSRHEKTSTEQSLRRDILLDMLSEGAAVTSDDSPENVLVLTRSFFRLLLLADSGLESKVRDYVSAVWSLVNAGHETEEREKLSNAYIDRERELLNYARSAYKAFGLPRVVLPPPATAAGLDSESPGPETQIAPGS